MTRKELYQQVTSLGLQNEIKSKYGRNYTQVSNADLETVVKKAIKFLESTRTSKVTKKSDCSNKFTKLVNILHKKNILLKSEVAEIMSI